MASFKNQNLALWAQLRHLEFVFRVYANQESNQFAPKQLDLSLTICYYTEGNRGFKEEKDILRGLGQRIVTHFSSEIGDVHKLRSFRILYSWDLPSSETLDSDQVKLKEDLYVEGMRDYINRLEVGFEEQVTGAKYKGSLSSRDEVRDAWVERIKYVKRAGTGQSFAID